MAQLTLRTLLAYIDDTLEPALARQLGAKVAESELARDLIERIKKVTRRRGLKSPSTTGTDGEVSDPNTVAEYLSDTLDGEQVTRLEQTCLESDVHLAEVAACHQILTIILTEPVRVPPQARQRMYALMKPPASVPNRRPGKTLPVGGVAPTLAGVAEPDDDDATLLLGMGRYGGGSFLGRVALVVAAIVLAGFLGVAVLMALPQTPPPSPDSSSGYVYAEVPPPAPLVPTPPEPLRPMPTPDSGKPPPPEPTPPTVVPPPSKPVEKKVTITPPSAERVVLGKAEGLNVIVLTRPDNAPGWVRLDPAGVADVKGNDPVLCLPGYKADVQLATGVKVRLWGNVPELLPDRILESHVRFHAPERKVEGKGEEFDADITLLAGRIYLSTTQPAGGRIRVRFGREVWDVTLSDDKTDVMVQLVSVFEAGMPYVRNRGSIQLEARVAVVRGTAGLVERSRSRTFEKVVSPKIITWDTHTRIASDPKPIEEGNVYYEKFPPLASEPGKVVQRALTDMAGRLTEPGGVKLMLVELLTSPPESVQPFLVILAIYAQAAILYGEAAGNELKPLIDLLTDDTRGVSIRVAVITALAAWIPHATGNSALLEQQLAPKLRQEGEPELILRLLRGYISPTKPDPGELDRLVDLLNYQSVAVRELALWNLLTIVDPAAVKDPKMVTDVAQTGPGYDKFVKAWQARVDEIKNRPLPKK